MKHETQMEVFAAIAHPMRRRILDLLAERERPVNDLAHNFGVSRPAVSQHLRLLRDAGLVAERRHGRERRYFLTPQPLAEVQDWLTHHERFWQERLRRFNEYLTPQTTTANDTEGDA